MTKRPKNPTHFSIYLASSEALGKEIDLDQGWLYRGTEYFSSFCREHDLKFDPFVLFCYCPMRFYNQMLREAKKLKRPFWVVRSKRIL